MATDKIYVKGFRSFPKHEKAPDFVLGTLIVTLEELKDFINNDARAFLTEYKDKKQLKIQVTKGQKGELVFAVDTWKAEAKEETKEQTMEEKLNNPAPKKTDEPIGYVEDLDDGNNLPF